MEVFRSLPFVLAFAHLRKRRTQNGVTLLGIAIGVMVLTTSLSLVNGFTYALLQTTLKATPHLLLRSYENKTSLALEKLLSSDLDVVAWSPILSDQGLITRPATKGRPAGASAVSASGITAQAAKVLDLNPEERELLEGLQPGEIVLGRSIADNLGAFRGDRLIMLNSELRRLELRLKGTFRTGNALIDGAFGFVRLETLQTVSSKEFTGYQVRLQDPEKARASALRYSASGEFGATTWQDYNQTTIQQLNLQKLVIGVIVFLIVVVAAFGIANVLLLSVYERTEEIAILRAMGTARAGIIGTFVLEGAILGIGGLILGNLLGLVLSYYFYVRPFPLPGELYFITALPTRIQPLDFLWVNALSLTVTLLASFIPARRAAGIEPARVIR